MKKHELLALVKSKAAEMQALADKAELTADEAAQFDKLETEVNGIKSSIERLEKVESLNREFEGEGQRVAALPARPKSKLDEQGGFHDFAEFATAVKSAHRKSGGHVDDRLKFLGAPSTTIHKENGSDDGYMVPPVLKNEIFEIDTGDFSILSLVDSEPTSSNSVQVLRDETTPWGSTGIQAYWGSEAGAMTRSKLETSGTDVKLHKLHAFVEVTEELMEDAPRLNSRLSTKSALAINYKLNEAVLDGTGVGQPLGYSASGCVVSQAKETGQAAATIVAANVLNMFARSTNPGGSVWIINRSCLAALGVMTIGNQPVWTAPNGLASAPGGLLMGRPVYFSEHTEVLGTVGDILFVDPKGYYMPNKGGIKASMSAHLLFDYDVNCFKWTFRAGGLPYLSAPISPKTGSFTRSSYIKLATRA